MGATYSACESCFGDKADPKSAGLSAKVVKSKSITKTYKAKLQKKPTKTFSSDVSLADTADTLSHKKSSKDHTAPDKSHKVQISDFDRIKVPSLLLDQPTNSFIGSR